MKKIVFSTDRNFTRPIISLYGQQALFDSGADIPSCNDAELLISEFNAKEVILPQKPSVRGVGNEKVFGRIFDSLLILSVTSIVSGLRYTDKFKSIYATALYMY